MNRLIRLLCTAPIVSLVCWAGLGGSAAAQQVYFDPADFTDKCQQVDTFWVTLDDQVLNVEAASFNFVYDQSIAGFVATLDTIVIPPALVGNVFLAYQPYAPDSLTVDIGILSGYLDGPAPLFGIVLSLVGTPAATDVVTARSVLRNSDNLDIAHSIGSLHIEITCCCKDHGQVNDDGQIDALDMNFFIDYIFAGGPAPPTDPGCPHTDRGDYNCDGWPDALDLVIIIDYNFAGGHFCDPCDCNDYPTDCPFDQSNHIP